MKEQQEKIWVESSVWSPYLRFYFFFTKTIQQNSVSNRLKEKSCLKLVNSIHLWQSRLDQNRIPAGLHIPVCLRGTACTWSTSQRQTKLERERSFITLEIQGAQINQGFRKAAAKKARKKKLLSSPVTSVLWLNCSHTAFSPESTFSTIAHAKEGVTKPTAEEKVGYPALVR